MKLKNVLVGLEGLKVRGSLDIEITNIENNSKNVKNDSMFVAIKGFDVDGHDYIINAIEKGASVILAQIDINREILKSIPKDITIVLCEDTRKALAICACNFYNNPSREVKLIGITGTKGKTITSFMIKSILEKSGMKVRTNRNYSLLYRREKDRR